MKEFKVVNLMVPLSEYATVSEDATLYEAVSALEKAQKEFNQTRYRHRAILVMDHGGKVIGKLTQMDAIKALEPKYDAMLDRRRFHHLGFSKEFMKSMLKEYHLFDSPLVDMCCKAGEQNVKKFMRTPSEGEFIDQNATMDEAIHQLVLGNHQSLLVLQQGSISGILRLTDVFEAVYRKMQACFSTFQGGKA